MKSIEVFGVFVIFIASCDALINGDIYPHTPYFARIEFRRVQQPNLFNAAGAIISDRHVISSAHFLTGAFDHRVFVGSSLRSNQEVFVSNFIAAFEEPHGISIILLTEHLKFSRTVQPIKLPPLVSASPITLENEQGMILGMSGSTEVTREYLHAVFMRTVSTSLCSLTYPIRDMQMHFCAIDTAARSDFCLDDRGSIFTVLRDGEETLAGIATEGVCTSSTHYFPSLFTRVDHFRNRIFDLIGF